MPLIWLHPLPFIFHSSQKFKQRAGDFQFCSFCERPEAGEPWRRRRGRPWIRVWIAGQTFVWSHSRRGCGGGSFSFEIALDFYRLALRELAALPRVNLWDFRGILGLLRLFFPPLIFFFFGSPKWLLGFNTSQEEGGGGRKNRARRKRGGWAC